MGVDTAVLLPKIAVGESPETVPPPTIEAVLLRSKLLPPGMTSPTIPPRSGRPVPVEAGSFIRVIEVGTDIVEKIPASQSSARPSTPRRSTRLIVSSCQVVDVGLVKSRWCAALALEVG
jgi:hypothetical protein